MMVAPASSPATMIGQSAALQPVYDLIGKVAATDANVLILGENGTGKELVAEALHRQSLRSQQPFVRVDVGAIAPIAAGKRTVRARARSRSPMRYHDQPGNL